MRAGLDLALVAALPIWVCDSLQVQMQSSAPAWPSQAIRNLDGRGQVMLKGLEFHEMIQSLDAVGERGSTRAKQLAAWMYRDSRLVRSLDACHSDSRKPHYNISDKSRQVIAEHFSVGGGIELAEVFRSSDGTVKLLHKLTSGPARGGETETVIIPMLQGPQMKKRYSVCVSSQVGCAMGCSHCFTGTMGLRGHLQTAQIVEQVVAAKRYLKESGDLNPITGVVFMGQGEPFDNYDAIMAAVRILTNPLGGPRLSSNRVTVSTVGVLPGIRAFCEDPSNRAQLALSLHATDDETRNVVVPTNRRWPIAELMSTLRTYFPLDGRKLVTIQYTLLLGVNDSTLDAQRLVELTEGIRCVINLISMNPWLEDTPYDPVLPSDARAFCDAVARGGRVCTFRDSKGDDEMSACGQLGRVGSGGRRARSEEEEEKEEVVVQKKSPK